MLRKYKLLISLTGAILITGIFVPIVLKYGISQSTLKNGSEHNLKNQKLSKDDRDLLMDFYIIYAKWDPNKTLNNIKIPTIPEDELQENSYYYEIVLDDLDKIGWDKEKLNFFKQFNDEEGEGWGEWSVNPFRHFFKNKEEMWREQIFKLQNNLSDHSVQENLEAEIEFEIAFWLIEEMKQIYERGIENK